MKTISSRKNSVVLTFRAAAKTSPRSRRHLLLDGCHLIEDACAAGLPLETVLLSAHALQSGDERICQLAETLDAAGVQTLAATQSVLTVVSPVRTPSGAVAIARPLPQAWEQVVDHIHEGLVVTAVGVQDPGNLGAIIRSADAGSACGVVVVGTSADPFGWRALRGAMGSTFRLPVATADTLESVIAAARGLCASVVAAVPRGGHPLYEVSLEGPQLLLVGPEGSGLAHDATTSADVRISIPMRRPVESLNVAVATALIVYEAGRQSRLKPERTHALPADTAASATSQ